MYGEKRFFRSVAKTSSGYCARARGLSFFALDNSVSSSKLPSIVVILLVRGLIESSRGSFATAPDPIVHSIIGAGNETQDYLLRSFRQIFVMEKKRISKRNGAPFLSKGIRRRAILPEIIWARTVCETLTLDLCSIHVKYSCLEMKINAKWCSGRVIDYHAIIYRSLLKSTDTNSMKSSVPLIRKSRLIDILYIKHFVRYHRRRKISTVLHFWCYYSHIGYDIMEIELIIINILLILTFNGIF